MEIYRSIIGNIHSAYWQSRSSEYRIEYIRLKEWQAQRSRMIVRSDDGRECAIALARHTPIKDGDILSAEGGMLVVIRLELSQIMVIDLSRVAELDPQQIISACVELGHALGNQHWPAVVKGASVYVPLTVDRRVMESVMQTHRFEHLHFAFADAKELLPHLSPSEVRRLLGSVESHSHSHAHQHE